MHRDPSPHPPKHASGGGPVVVAGRAGSCVLRAACALSPWALQGWVCCCPGDAASACSGGALLGQGAKGRAGAAGMWPQPLFARRRQGVLPCAADVCTSWRDGELPACCLAAGVVSLLPLTSPRRLDGRAYFSRAAQVSHSILGSSFAPRCIHLHAWHRSPPAPLARRDCGTADRCGKWSSRPRAPGAIPASRRAGRWMPTSSLRPSRTPGLLRGLAHRLGSESSCRGQGRSCATGPSRHPHPTSLARAGPTPAALAVRTRQPFAPWTTSSRCCGWTRTSRRPPSR